MSTVTPEPVECELCRTETNIVECSVRWETLMSGREIPVTVCPECDEEL